LDKLLYLEIITSDRKIFSGEVKSVTAPGTLGEFQVLYNHAPLVSTLEIGKIKINDVSGNEIIYASSGGILEVRDNKVILLADAIERMDEIDIPRAEKALSNAKEKFDSHIDIDRTEEILAMKRAQNRLKISKK
jgi:F-type H+-transporting ATPase subunit epsilon